MSRPTISIPAGNEQVLLAVEDEVSADLLLHRMTRRGIHPEHVEDGEEAFNRIQVKAYDLILIETRLPGLTGLELLRRTPSDEIAGDPQIILLGRRGNNEEIVRAFELGAVEYIQRPFAPEVALARIFRFLGTSHHLVSRTPAAGCVLLTPGPVSVGGVLESGTLLAFMGGIAGVFVILAFVFAGIAMVTHLREKGRERRRHTLRQQWKTQLLDVLAADLPPQRLIDQVSSSQERLFLEFLVPYAATLEGRAQELLTRLATPFLTHLEEDLQARNAGRRARTVQLFGMLGDASCRGILRRCLDDPSPLVARTAFRWLARRGRPRDAEFILSRLDRLSNYDVSQLSSAMVHLGEEAAPVLRSCLGDDAQPTFVRIVCAETLRWMGDGEAASLGAQLLVYGTDPELTAALLRLLRRVGRPEHAPIVRSYCDSDVSFVRIHAARALGQIGDPDDDEKILRDLVSGAESRWVALNAAKSLTELDQKAPLRLLSRSGHERADLAASVLKEPQ